jgi:transposase
MKKNSIVFSKSDILSGRKDVDNLLRWPMYSKIHELKAQKIKKAQVARKLSLDPKTVTRFWNMTPEEFLTFSNKKRKQKLDKYETVIVNRLREFPDLSAAQIMDWLIEIYDDTSLKERTVRRYVAWLRKKHQMPKPITIRQYEAVEELPPGVQLQIDFGQIAVPKTDGGKSTVYCMGAVLSHSRYKYAEWSDKPLTTPRLVTMLKRCFKFFGGVPQELVFDQDKLVAVSENYGDIIFTTEFEQFKQFTGFSVYLCRKNDPESKGKVEAVVKYLKNNFAKHRLFTSLTEWNQAQLDWLERTGNAKEHGTTKKVPAQAFLLEKQHLRPVPSIKIPDDILTVMVRKDNTILYKSNRYSVPLGTYRPGRKLSIKEDTGILNVIDPETGEVLAEHSVCHERGKLIKNRHHSRDLTAKVDELFEQTLTKLGNSLDAEKFLAAIRLEKRRYARDQFKLMEHLASQYSADIITKAIGYCLNYRLYSAVDCRDAAEYFAAQNDTVDEVAATVLSISPKRFSIQTEQRSLAAYTRLYGGDSK